MKAWHDRFFHGLYGRVLAAQFNPAVSLKQARLIRRLLRVRRGARVLDVPCGMGRITVPLARSGLRMTGVDVTPGFIRGAKAAAHRAGVKARFLVADMRRLEFDGEFDAAFNWFTSWGYFSDRENLESLRGICRSLRLGGRFLVEGMNRTWIARHLNLKRNVSRIGGVEVVQRSYWSQKTSRMSTLWILRRGRRVERHLIRVFIWDGADIRRILHAAGFRDVRLYGRGGKPFSRHSPRIIAVASRSG